MRNLISIAILVLDIFIIMDIINNVRNTEKKILWIVAVIFLPLLGPLLYYIIHKK